MTDEEFRQKVTEAEIYNENCVRAIMCTGLVVSIMWVIFVILFILSLIFDW